MILIINNLINYKMGDNKNNLLVYLNNEGDGYNGSNGGINDGTNGGTIEDLFNLPTS